MIVEIFFKKGRNSMSDLNVFVRGFNGVASGLATAVGIVPESVRNSSAIFLNRLGTDPKDFVCKPALWLNQYFNSYTPSLVKHLIPAAQAVTSLMDIFGAFSAFPTLASAISTPISEKGERIRHYSFARNDGRSYGVTRNSENLSGTPCLTPNQVVAKRVCDVFSWIYALTDSARELKAYYSLPSRLDKALPYMTLTAATYKAMYGFCEEFKFAAETWLGVYAKDTWAEGWLGGGEEIHPKEKRLSMINLLTHVTYLAQSVISGAELYYKFKGKEANWVKTAQFCVGTAGVFVPMVQAMIKDSRDAYAKACYEK
jgi:hypothetical protein